MTADARGFASRPSRHPAVAVLGASGGVGRRIVARLRAAGRAVVAQSRDARRLSDLDADVRVAAFDPVDRSGYARFLEGAGAVIFALGLSRPGRTTLFSEATRALLPAMRESGVARLVAITGVGAGETRGHGGAVYNRLVFPLITRPVYIDKDRQEALIEGSGLEWTILRPAPFRKRQPSGPLQVHTAVPPRLQLAGISRDEVAAFAVEEIEARRHVGRKVFFGHA